MWCILAKKNKVDDHRERVSNYAMPFDELNQNDIPFLMKIKDISAFEQLSNLNINVFNLSSNDKILSLTYINKNSSEQQIDLLLYENHYCLLSCLHNFRRKNGKYKHLCRICSNTHGDQTKLEEHLLGCIQQEVCIISYMHPNQEIKLKD